MFLILIVSFSIWYLSVVSSVTKLHSLGHVATARLVGSVAALAASAATVVVPSSAIFQ